MLPRTAPHDRQASSDANQDPIRVVFATNVSSGFSLPVLQKLHECPDISVTHVLLYDNIAANKSKLLQTIRKRGFSWVIRKVVGVAKRNVRNLLPQASAQHRRTPARTCHDYAVTQSLPFAVVRNLNDSDRVEHLKYMHTDVLLTCSLSQILSGEILTAARVGAINIHPSLLPQHRGPLPAFWVLYFGESTTGVTFHLLAAGIDTGDIVAQFAVDIDPGWREQHLLRQLSLEAARHCVGVIRGFVSGQLEPRPQDDADATYQSFPSPAQRRQLARKLRRSADA